MATLIVCDGGCGAHSPDFVNHRRGPHIANGWLKVRAGRPRAREELSKWDEKVFCDECAPRVLDAIAPRKGASQ